ncbi:MAG: OmpA family protein [Bacteroidetes bacterium]|nr:OmpA family protein [Bacteroidota bacterium]
MRLFSGLILLLPLLSLGQSFLPNTDFSNLNICCEYRVSCAPMGWWTTSGGTFNFKRLQYDKYKRPIPMPAYIKMMGKKEFNERSYIQGPLLCPLEAGKEYILSIEYSFPDQIFQELGVYFSDSFIHVPRKVFYQVDSLTGSFRKFEIDSLLDREPQVLFTLNKGWIRSGIYKAEIHYRARGNERFLVLGNFYSDDQSLPQKGPFNKNDGKQDLLAIHSINLQAVSGVKCNCQDQLKILETLNRRHSFYGACRDSLPRNMNQLFSMIPQWFARQSSPDTSEKLRSLQLNQAYRIHNIYFDFDLSILKPTSFPALDSLATVLLPMEVLIEITGHTDSLGEAAYNDSLSLHRAQSVKEYLIQKGIAAKRITAIGMGSRLPISSNSNENGRQMNRRVEFILREVSAHTH